MVNLSFKKIMTIGLFMISGFACKPVYDYAAFNYYNKYTYNTHLRIDGYYTGFIPWDSNLINLKVYYLDGTCLNFGTLDSAEIYYLYEKACQDNRFTKSTLPDERKRWGKYYISNDTLYEQYFRLRIEHHKTNLWLFKANTRRWYYRVDEARFLILNDSTFSDFIFFQKEGKDSLDEYPQKVRHQFVSYKLKPDSNCWLLQSDSLKKRWP